MNLKDHRPKFEQPCETWPGCWPRTGTRKIADLSPEEICRHPEHNPPTMQVFPDGHYEHVCPGCGNVQKFSVRNPTC